MTTCVLLDATRQHTYHFEVIKPSAPQPKAKKKLVKDAPKSALAPGEDSLVLWAESPEEARCFLRRITSRNQVLPDIVRQTP